MTPNNNLRSLLTRCLNPHGDDASAEEVSTSLERVWRRMQPDVLRVSAPSFVPPGRQRAWTFLPRAVAAMLVLGVAIGTAMVWPRGARVYAAGADGLQVTLADDSRVEMRAYSEMIVGRASDGIQIDLKTGDIIITAAEQRGGQLYVRTNDMTVAVDGTAFLAHAGQQGSRVGVIEGEVRVREGDTERRLRPGEQVATSPTIARRLLTEDIAWSRNAEMHLAKVDVFMKGVAQTTAPLTPVARQADVTAAQTPGSTGAALEFEEASIRPCDPDNLPVAVGSGRGGGGGPSSVYMTPGRFYALCMTPATLIRTAYGYRSVDQEISGGSPGNPEAPGRMRPISANSVYGAPAEDGQRVRGGADWVRTERYTIEAVASVGDGQDTCIPESIGGRAVPLPPGLANRPNRPCRTANSDSMSGPMLRALLERRFGLKAHIVTEQTQAFSLVVAPGGLKMKEEACTPDPSAPPLGSADPRMRRTSEAERARQFMEMVRRHLNAARRGDATTGCGVGMADNGPNRIFVDGGETVPGLVGMLRGILGAPVTNRTGIPGTSGFNFALEFLVDERTKRNPLGAITDAPLQMADDPSSVPPAPDFFKALEQQLGLRLEPSQQVTREYIVIDAIERPGPN